MEIYKKEDNKMLKFLTKKKGIKRLNFEKKLFLLVKNVYFLGINFLLFVKINLKILN